MPKKAIIFDLDNTIYSVRSIGNEIFAPLFEILFKDGANAGNAERIKEEIMRTPFQKVASEFQFSEEMTQQCLDLLKNSRYSGAIKPFEDYQIARSLPIEKFLVTTGFLNLQDSKIDGMNIRADFKEIDIVDPMTSTRTKKDVFANILKNHQYNNTDLLVVGDDMHSEIKAAQELGIDVVLYDKFNIYQGQTSVPKISNFQQLEFYI